jgi:hypothetical protein
MTRENRSTSELRGFFALAALILCVVADAGSPTTPNPVARNDSAADAISKSIRIDVLANDTAASGRSLNLNSVTIVSPPLHGTATVDSNGSITYQPAGGFSGMDAFQYAVNDDFGERSDMASVFVHVQPAPAAANDTATLKAGQTSTINVLANDKSTVGTLNPASIHIVVPPAHGTATVVAGQVVYTPAPGYSGLDSFQYSVQDNLGTASNVATVSMEVTAPGGGTDTGGGGGGELGFLELLLLVGVMLLRLYELESPAATHSITARQRSTSASVVAQLQTLMRIAVRPCHTVAPHQQVPSLCRAATTRRVRSGSPNATST